MRIYQYPGGPVIGLLAQNQLLTIMPQEVIYGNLVWVQVVDSDGREGWVPKIFIHILTPTASPSATVTPLVICYGHYNLRISNQYQYRNSIKIFVQFFIRQNISDNAAA